MTDDSYEVELKLLRYVAAVKGGSGRLLPLIVTPLAANDLFNRFRDSLGDRIRLSGWCAGIQAASFAPLILQAFDHQSVQLELELVALQFGIC